MQEYDLSQWILFFFLYSFLGWVWESCYVSVRKHRWVNRGFMHGPMLPLYGSGAMVVLIVTIPVRDNIPLVFLMGMIGATILEYFTGITMERLFHVRYWDYRNLKFNVRGYICPIASLCWGVFSILMVKVVHVPFEHIVLLIPVTIADILAFVLTIAAAVDFTQSFNEAMDMKRILVQLEASKEQIQKMQECLKDASEEMQDRLKDASEEMQDKLKGASEGVQERLKRASEGVQEKLEDSYLLYEERKEMKAAEKQTRKEMYLAKIEEQRRERKEQLTQLSEKVETLLRTARLENEAQESESKGNWRKELAQMRANIVSERQKLGSRTNRNYVNAMRQLRRNPTAVSDKFKNAMEELKKNAEVK